MRSHIIPLNYAHGLPLPWRRGPRVAMVILILMISGLFVHRIILPEVRRMQARAALDDERCRLLDACMTHTTDGPLVVFDEEIDPIPRNDVSASPGYRSLDVFRLNEPWHPTLKRADLAHPPRPVPHANHPQGAQWSWAQGSRRLVGRRSKWNELLYLDDEFTGYLVKHRNDPPYAYDQRVIGQGYESDEVFLHGRRAKDGEERLVAVGFDPPGFVNGDPTPFKVQVVWRTWAWRPLQSNRSHDAWGFQFSVPTHEKLLLYTGMPDPDDESHFTISYSKPSGSGIIDGWLLPDDTVRLVVRDGPAAERP